MDRTANGGRLKDRRYNPSLPFIRNVPIASIVFTMIKEKRMRYFGFAK